MSFDYILLMRFLSEFTATAFLVCLSCFGCAKTSSEVTPLQSSLQFGLVTMIIMHCFGFVSGAHANPCISLACYMSGYITSSITFIYICAQLLGACVGYYLLTVLLPDDLVYSSKPELCRTVPQSSVTVEQAFGIEFILTSIYIFGWCALWDMRNIRFLDSISLRMGLIVTACMLGGGNFTGASMNPARTLAPAIFHQNFEYVWIYFTSQIAAALTVPLIWHYGFTPRYRLLMANIDGVDQTSS